MEEKTTVMTIITVILDMKIGIREVILDKVATMEMITLMLN